MRRSQFHCSKKTEHVRSKRFGLLLARCANASMCWFALCEINVEDQCCVALMAVFSLSISLGSAPTPYPWPLTMCRGQENIRGKILLHNGMNREIVAFLTAEVEFSLSQNVCFFCVFV